MRREGGSSDDVIVDSSGNVGVGTSTPGSKLTIDANFTGYNVPLDVRNSGSSHPYLWVAQTFSVNTGSVVEPVGRILSTSSSWTYGTFGSNKFTIEGMKSGGIDIRSNIGAPITFSTGGTQDFSVERARIDSSGRLLVGTATVRANFLNSTSSPNVQIEGVGADGGSLALVTNFNSGNSSTRTSVLQLGRAGSTSLGSNTIVAANNFLGSVIFSGNDGSEFVSAASIDGQVDGTPGANVMPGRIVLSTTAAGAATPTERLRIDSSGNVGINNTNPDQKLVVAGNIRTTGSLYGPSNFIIDPSTVGDDTGTVEIKGNLVVQGTTTTINSTTVDLDHLSLGDNEVANFGNSNDLQIYHNGSNSYIDDAGTGNLIIGAANFQLMNVAHTENHITASDNGSVAIYYDAVQKFQTTLGGVRIGSSTAPIDINAYETLNNGTLSFEGSAGQLFSITNNLTSGSIFSVNDVSGIPSIDVDADGTVSLAEFGGTVAIGTSNGYTIGAVSTHKLTISSADILAAGPSSTDMFYIRHQGVAGNFALQTVVGISNLGNFHLQPYGGNVGIGTANPPKKLTVNGDILVADENKIFLNSNADIALNTRKTFGNVTFKYVWTLSFDGLPAPYTIVQSSNDYSDFLNANLELTYVSGTQPSGTVYAYISIASNTIDLVAIRQTSALDYDDTTVFELSTTTIGSGTQNLQFKILNSNFTRPAIPFLSLGGDTEPSNYTYTPDLLKIGNNNFENLSDVISLTGTVSVGHNSFNGTLPSSINSNAVGNSCFLYSRLVNYSVGLGTLIGGFGQTYSASVGIGYQFSLNRNASLDIGIGHETVGESAPRGSTELTYTITTQPTSMPADGTYNNVYFVDKLGTKTYNYTLTIVVSGGAITSTSLGFAFLPKDLPAVNDVMSTTNASFAGMELTVNSVTEIGGGYNVGVGGYTLRFIDGASGNTGIGHAALNNIGTGSYNTALGHNSGSAITTGNYNVVIGSNNGSTIATSSNNIILSDGQGNIRQFIDSNGNVGIGVTGTIGYKLEVNGSFAATTKSFLIPHPTKENYKLRHGSLEGPENGVYVRGRTSTNIIELPDYWTGLVDADSITVNLTPIGKTQTLWVKEIKDNKVFVGSKCATVEYFYTVFGERKDVEKLEVEF